MTNRLRGVIAPVLTPFDDRLEPDVGRFIAHSRWLVDRHAGLAIFGTNSEAASLSVAERLALTDALLEGGVPAAKLMPGTGACALPDAVALTRHASRIDAAGVLVLPPFYFKGVSDDGVFAYYAEIIERVGSGCAPLYLYHIPQMSQVPITLGLIERLLKRYPGVIAGAKDSSGDWRNAKAMIDHFAAAGFDVFPASESLLSQAMPIGGAGCISATVNMNPVGIHRVFQGWQSAETPALQAKADAVRKIFQATPMIPAMKHVVSHFSGHASWRTVRPPLVALDEAAGRDVLAQLDAAGFDMPNYPR
ncbi:dihydrodipicolinate synthase family protein [Verminephrobacter eiseniae]|uniref:dihydrodipicolinate synthase family protein n=1 Tax=Verminephrobacter eiseniae TaxID=364317 RepID=UPI002238091C|nr:dihydrodipicolinate synthase family protein [Verminephrobacter eiseniae]MCW5296183.1 dihydrodipicolinate synthase family protein [Verminephrobacter eiseniae]MCW8185418.1 dihydrodipicolinate synthase family protein [Verminephrobacter eiseniae]MCW8224107.1 dihydrodipicolinate synthase family protein [Verminephrobacter eiseniae]MCW8235215.1 dihydrodipicolinate synthase family protein [Verminephrobacter eiseniae]